MLRHFVTFKEAVESMKDAHACSPRRHVAAVVEWPSLFRIPPSTRTMGHLVEQRTYICVSPRRPPPPPTLVRESGVPGARLAGAVPVADGSAGRAAGETCGRRGTKGAPGGAGQPLPVN